jgi:dihydroneopterin aldolase
MADDLDLAFAHPSARAVATANPTKLLDRISLRDHIAQAEIGAFQAERGTRQRLRFNVVVEVTPPRPPLDDDVDRILSYDRVTEAIAAELAAGRVNLLETLAENVAERILLSPQALRTFVRVEKLDRGPGALGVEIARTRSDYGPRLAEIAEIATREMPRPRIVYLPNPALVDPRLPGWLDTLAADVLPVILCVGAPDAAVLQTGHAMTQRRIDLLAIEQSAWALAARDPRCIVVATRTELDWVMRQGGLSVWAPSKLVLDAVEGPAPRVDGPGLALWLAGLLDASDVLGIGANLPQGGNIRTRTVPLDGRLLPPHR